MAEFKESQKKYIQAKNAWRQAATELYLARQQYEIIENRIADFLKAHLLDKLPGGHELNTLRNAALKKINQT